MTDTILKNKSITGDESSVLHKLILFNSNHIWDDVISQLCKATGFDMLKCEQIAVFAHTKGKALVCTGEISKLNNINSVLKEINLITEIE
ncbi:MAG: ATP-dependent Clp protease adaptor ClpS [Bacteroidetes bacterium]|nr:ATP-dependent Clp protease adaptor ClpS [Bacteroidota bacterium]